MQVRWEYLTPPDFEKLAREEKLCILPIGSLERHGEHMPFGTDALVAHEIACRAALKEPCVVFPPYWFGQVHEAACFSGTVNFPADFTLKMLEMLLDQIASNGFEKILIVNGHGGNSGMLDYYIMSHSDRKVPYTLYTTFLMDGSWTERINHIWDNPDGGHADECETSMMMATVPGTVRLEYQRFAEPILPIHELTALENVKTGMWWYDLYPEHVSGRPSAATQEKGEITLNAAAEELVKRIRAVKQDSITPKLQQAFHERHDRLGK